MCGKATHLVAEVKCGPSDRKGDTASVFPLQSGRAQYCKDYIEGGIECPTGDII